MLGIAQSYDAARIDDCRTAGLLPDLGAERRDVWWDYLLNYTNALAGCPLFVAPLPGGIEAFGPANTAVLGIEHADFTPETARLLIDEYVAAFGGALGLTASERVSVQVYIGQAAAGEIALDASDWTSRCSVDAGVVDGGER